MQVLGVILCPGFQVMSLPALSVLEFANKEMDKPVYDVRLLSEAGGPVRSSIGISVATESFRNANLDTLIVGGSNMIGSLTPRVIKFLRLALRRYRRVASTCTGAFIFAAAGVLDGRRAPPHRKRARGVQARVPKTEGGGDRLFIAHR